ncbi:hypothetical protein DM02DRAFT_663095 [Periconia macrospinosa]|uniref:Uncharacterized protein n=1 Tax=Periconia macrospinosa TaxID=97972 RepID=A0A2V1D2M9_9PLEO|nr:hypothetical protein DM02DRAFT_663095 [Periconia macrospinosa]
MATGGTEGDYAKSNSNFNLASILTPTVGSVDNELLSVEGEPLFDVNVTNRSLSTLRQARRLSDGTVISSAEEPDLVSKPKLKDPC